MSTAPFTIREIDHAVLRVVDLERSVRFYRDGKMETGEVASRFGADGKGPSIYLTDPDGNRVELKGPPE